MPCGTCPQCGGQMEVTRVYTSTVCMCPDCGYKQAVQKNKLQSLREYTKKNPKG